MKKEECPRRQSHASEATACSQGALFPAVVLSGICIARFWNFLGLMTPLICVFPFEGGMSVAITLCLSHHCHWILEADNFCGFVVL